MSILRSMMAAKEAFQMKRSEFNNGLAVTFSLQEWLAMQNYYGVKPEDCVVYFHNSEGVRVIKFEYATKEEQAAEIRKAIEEWHEWNDWRADHELD